MRLTFLTADEARARELIVPDVYFDPTYGESAELVDGGSWECAVADDGQHWYPYVRRNVPDDRDAYDIVSPYGYSGVAGAPGAGVRAFRLAFFQQSRERGLVAEFLRTNPRDVSEADLSDLGIDTFRSHRTYGITWDSDPDEYFCAAEGRHRTAVRRAVKEGLYVVQSPIGSAADARAPFRVVYDATMHRVGASSRLRLGAEYFTRLAALGDRHAVILEVRGPDDATLAAAIFLLWRDRVHYHLSGSSAQGQRLGATNLMIDHAARAFLPPGGWLHLGGGLTADDGLDRFKRSLSTTPTDTLLCQTVVDRQRYAELCERFGATQTSYFPAYRAALS